jgi:hypothetical protein
LRLAWLLAMASLPAQVCWREQVCWLEAAWREPVWLEQGAAASAQA